MEWQGSISLKIAQNRAEGFLQVNVNSSLNQAPISDAVVDIAYSDDPDNIIEELRTNSLGQTQEIELPAPELEYSLEPTDVRPYAEYTVTIRAAGYEPLTITGTQVLADAVALQPARLEPVSEGGEAESITIPEHTLYGEFPPKIPEEEVKPTGSSGEIVLSRVVIPEYIVVHDGVPSDSTAPNYYIPYTDYIKNVASSEIYATWPEAAILANILAIQSFTMNRVYTEW